MNTQTNIEKNETKCRRTYFLSHALFMQLVFFSVLIFLILAGCTSQTGQTNPSPSLTEARSSFKTTLVPQNVKKEPVDQAPKEIFLTIKYPSKSGELWAYLSPNPGDGKKHPAVIWITGGDCNSIGDVWTPAPIENDQTAAAYRDAGIVMMFPSLRGGNDNPGVKEGFLGEVDDILAAARYLETLDYIDSQRIYLGGHSTGGTLALLVSESSDRFRAVFSFGPVSNIMSYYPDLNDYYGLLPFDVSNQNEIKLRSPIYWLGSVRAPVWVIEGVKSSSNITSLRAMAKANTNPNIHFIEIKNADHFIGLAPTNELIAQKILADTGDANNFTLTGEEVNQNNH